MQVHTILGLWISARWLIYNFTTVAKRVHSYAKLVNTFCVFILLKTQIMFYLTLKKGNNPQLMTIQCICDPSQFKVIRLACGC